jgi:hypothetical protein
MEQRLFLSGAFLTDFDFVNVLAELSGSIASACWVFQSKLLLATEMSRFLFTSRGLFRARSTAEAAFWMR